MNVNPQIKPVDQLKGCCWLLVGPWVNGWAFMLVVGIIHGSWWSTVPTVGYIWAVAIVALLRLAFGSWVPSAAVLARQREIREVRKAEREAKRREQKFLMAMGERMLGLIRAGKL